MPQPRLLPEQVDFIMKMKQVEYSNVEIARKLGVTEGAIRSEDLLINYSESLVNLESSSL